MDSINFLKEGLKELYHSLSYLEIKYEYRASISTHIIEVKPVHCYEKDNLYIQQQITLEDKFAELFPYEEILFMSENALIQIVEPILELGTSLVEQKSHNLIEVNNHVEIGLQSVSFDLTEFFGILSKVNASNTPYYINCSQIDIHTLIVGEFNELSLPDSYYVYKPPTNCSDLENKNKATKKDSEINQSLFFLLILQHD